MTDVRAVFRILSDLRDLRHDSSTLHQHLANELVRLMGASAGFAADISGWHVSETPVKARPFLPRPAARINEMFKRTTVAIQGQNDVVGGMQSVYADNDLWVDPTYALCADKTDAVESFSMYRLRKQSDDKSKFELFDQFSQDSGMIDHVVGWYQEQVDAAGKGKGKIRVGVAHRFGRGEKPFTERDVAVSKLLMGELGWLHKTGRLDSPVAGTDKLPPRLKQVLQLILKGKPPKEIARTLGLSLATVRDYIKAIYRRFGVNGRDELMARFLRTID